MNLYKKTRLCGLILITGIILLPKFVFSFDDGFIIARKAESEHFNIYYAPELDPMALSQTLNIAASDELLNKRASGSGNSLLSSMVDALFSQVCNILDMQLYSYQGNIKVCRDHKQLSEIYHNLFGKDLSGRESFYVYDLNTIYISAISFKREILGHEIAHAVISHYFVVLPSVKIQEVLSSYVEYQLRKSGQR